MVNYIQPKAIQTLTKGTAGNIHHFYTATQG